MSQSLRAVPRSNEEARAFAKEKIQVIIAEYTHKGGMTQSYLDGLNSPEMIDKLAASLLPRNTCVRYVCHRAENLI